MTRGLAFLSFVCAAFAWTPPGIDRAGLAALGLGFLALAVGRASAVARPAILGPLFAASQPPMPDVPPKRVDLRGRIGAYVDEQGAHRPAGGFDRHSFPEDDAESMEEI